MSAHLLAETKLITALMFRESEFLLPQRGETSDVSLSFKLHIELLVLLDRQPAVFESVKILCTLAARGFCNSPN